MALERSYRETHLGPLLEAHAIRNPFRTAADPELLVRRRNVERLTLILKEDLLAREEGVRRGKRRARALAGPALPGESAEARDARNRQALGLLWDAAWAAGGVDAGLESLMTETRRHTLAAAIVAGDAPVFHLSIDVEGRRLILGVGPHMPWYQQASRSGRTLVWDLAGGRVERAVDFAGAGVRPLAVSGEFVLTYRAGMYRLLNWRNGGFLWERRYPPGEDGYSLPSGSFTRDGRLFAITLGSEGAAVLETARLREVFRVEGKGRFSTACLSPSGEWLLLGRNLIPVREGGRAEVKESDNPWGHDARGIAFHPELDCFAVGRLGVHVRAVAEGTPLLEALGRGFDPSVPEFREPEGVKAAAFSPDGHWLAAVDVAERKPWDLDRRASLLRVWRARDWSLHACFEAGDKAASLCWSPDSKKVWVGLEEGGVHPILVDWDGAMAAADRPALPPRMTGMSRDDRERLESRARGKASLPPSVAAALEELRRPVTRGTPHLWQRLHEGFHENIHWQAGPTVDLLKGAPASLDPWLVDLGLSGPSPSARHLATHLLAIRGDPAALPLIEAGCANPDPEERHLAVRALQAGAAAGRPMKVATLLPLLAYETDGRTMERLAMTLGELRSVEAVPALRKAIRLDPRFTYGIWALGRIGAAEATPDIIGALLHETLNPHFAFRALGELATPEAVDFLILHLDGSMAPEALAATKGDRTLPALRRHLEILRAAGGDEDDLNLSETVVAVIRLTHADPREALLAAAEDGRERPAVRHKALWALCNHETRAFDGRILRIYRESVDPEINMFCVLLLRESALPGVTEAMVREALSVSGQAIWYAADGLLDTLNRRLGTKFKDFEALRAHLRGRHLLR